MSGPKGAYLSLVIDSLADASRTASLVITPTEREAESIVQDSDSFGSAPVALFPWWGTAPYEGSSPLASIFGERVHILSRLLEKQALMVVAPLRALLTPVPDPAYLAAQAFTVAKGDRMDPQATADRLSRAGYLRVPTATVHGEFAVRGEVIDVYMPGQEQAVRITLDFDRVTGIRSFDPLDQGSTGSLASVKVTPCREVVLDEGMLTMVRAGLSAQGFSAAEIDDTVTAVVEDPDVGGVELFYPCAFPRSIPSLTTCPTRRGCSLWTGKGSTETRPRCARSTLSSSAAPARRSTSFRGRRRSSWTMRSCGSG